MRLIILDSFMNKGSYYAREITLTNIKGASPGHTHGYIIKSNVNSHDIGYYQKTLRGKSYSFIGNRVDF